MSRLPRARGFTLIEVLVVVVIVGIISAVVLLSLNLVDDDRALREEARRLATLLDLAADEALLQGRDFGLDVGRRGYRFVEYDPYNEQWYELTDDELLRARQLPEELRFELLIEDRLVDIDEELAAIPVAGEVAGSNASYAPQALILSSGTIYPFELRLLREFDDSVVRIEVTPEGNIEVRTREDDER